jgi:hypothetical protein
MSRTKNSIDKKVESKAEILAPTEEEKNIYAPKSKKQLLEEKLRPFIEEETKLVKGRFRNYETPGGYANIYCGKYPGVPHFKRMLLDGEVYEIPLYVARFLNGVDVTAKACDERINTCSYVVHSHNFKKDSEMVRSFQDENGNLITPETSKKFVKRYGFESLEFDKAV